MFLGSMLHSSDTAKISENPKSGRKIARVLVIYTGGTIGMKNDKENGKIFLVFYIFAFTWWYFDEGLNMSPLSSDFKTNMWACWTSSK